MIEHHYYTSIGLAQYTAMLHRAWVRGHEVMAVVAPVLNGARYAELLRTEWWDRKRITWVNPHHFIKQPMRNLGCSIIVVDELGYNGARESKFMLALKQHYLPVWIRTRAGTEKISYYTEFL